MREISITAKASLGIESKKHVEVKGPGVLLLFNHIANALFYIIVDYICILISIIVTYIENHYNAIG